MNQLTDQPMSAEEFLEHFGVKGMKWGVRKESSPKSDRAVIATKTAQNLTVLGASQAGRILGAAGGTTLGPIYGTMIGGYAGGYVGGRVGARVVFGDVKKKAANAKKDLNGTLKNRNANYKDGSAKRDIDSFGPDAAQRINRSMNSGMKLAQAREAERKLQMKVALISAGAGIAQVLAVNKTVNYLQSPEGNAKTYAYAKAAGNARRANGAAKEAQRAARPAGLGFIREVKPNRKGVYNISSLK